MSSIPSKICKMENCNNPVFTKGSSKGRKPCHCEKHRDPAVRNAEKIANKKMNILKDFGYVQDKDYPNMVHFKDGAQMFYIKNIDFAHFEPKLENTNKNKGDRRGRNNPADLIIKNNQGSISEAELNKEIKKTFPLPHELHQLIDNGISFTEIKKSHPQFTDLIDVYASYINEKKGN